MAITPEQYPLLIAAPMLQDYLVDKDTGTPLAGGIVTFYQDTQRSFLKNIYYQTGTPGSYSYTPLPNPVILTSVGTFADAGGNDVIPFYFPFDENDDETVQTYYVTVYSADQTGNPAIEQWTRANFPFISQENVTPENPQQDLINLIPNGQFTANNTLPNAGLFPNGQGSVVVAPGGSAGWYFAKPTGSTDNDFITFTQILEEPANLPGNPRYAIDIECATTAASDTFKNLRMRFNNVNRFSSETQTYTFSFAGMSTAASSVNVALEVIKNYGTGGSATSTTTIEQFTLEPGTWKQYSITFIFGSNAGQTIGTLNDDYVELAMAFPSTTTFDLEMTDFILTPGTVIFTAYPERPDNMVFANGIVGSLPTPAQDGSSYYLPIVATPAGATYDSSIVGQLIISPATFNYGLLCDGSSYLTTAYTTTGVPYTRLQAYLLNAGSLGVPLYGTGYTFVNTNIADSTTTSLRITTNQAGAQTNASDGLAATGFTFATIAAGQTVVASAYTNGAHSLIGIPFAAGSVTNVNAGNSGFTVAQLVNNAVSFGSFTVNTTAGSSITASHYFKFSTPSVTYYCWFKVNGSGSDPAPGGTGIQVNILSTYTAVEVGNCVREAISGFAISSVIVAAASTLTAGDYFKFNANGTTYNVWYKIAGAGTAPLTGTAIPVLLTGTETAAQVATATQQAMNSFYVGVPDFRSYFLRALPGTDGQFDVTSGSRWSTISGYYGNKNGTFELDTFQNHIHGFQFVGYNTGGSSITAAVLANEDSLTTNVSVNNFSILSTGGAETQPVNAGVNIYIRY